MKFSYFQFLFRNIINKKIIWISLALYFLIYFFIIIIFPLSWNVSPFEIWTNSHNQHIRFLPGGLNIQIFVLLFASFYMSSVSYCVFVNENEDGSILIISSKPINKWLINFSKFIVWLSFVLIAIGVATFTMLLTYSFGKYDLNNNPRGIEFSLMGPIIGSLICGNIIELLLVGSISAIISCYWGKIIIYTSTIGIVIFICSLELLYSMGLKSPIDHLKENYNTTINSAYYQNKSNDLNFSGYIENPWCDTYTYYTKANNESGLVQSYNFNPLFQISNLFYLFEINQNKIDKANNQMFGSNLMLKYQINKNGRIIENPDLIPNFLVIYNESTGINIDNVIFNGMNSNNNLKVFTEKEGFVSACYITFNDDGSYSYSAFNYDEIKVANECIKIISDEFIELQIQKYKSDLSYSYDVFRNDLFDFTKKHFSDLGLPGLSTNASINFGSLKVMVNCFNILSQKMEIDLLKNFSTFENINSEKIIEFYENEKGENYKLLSDFFNNIIYKNIPYDGFTTKPDEKGKTKCIPLFDSFGKYDVFSNAYTYHTENFVDTNLTIGVYLFLSIVLYGFSILIYCKKDFK